jgi:SAM-dependent methyltransferase
VSERLTVREMMFGTGEPFSVQRCGGCGSLWLADGPDDLSPYYGEGYYSMREHAWPAARLGRVRSQVLLRLGHDVVRRMADGWEGIPRFIWWLAGLGLGPRSRIADVGSGEGDLLFEMAAHGFADLWGFDPFIAGDLDRGPVHLRRLGLDGGSGAFDMIMYNHALEHLDDPLAALVVARERLAPDGRILVRVPIAGSAADRRYREHWVSIDAPRHQYVPTELGLRRLAERAGLRVQHAFYDSTGFQFWGSEQYSRGIALQSRDSVATTPPGVFSFDELARWESEALALNRERQGDTAGFILAA